MATKILDSWALLAFFKDEPVADAVEKLLTQAATDDNHRLLLSVVTWGELYCTIMQEVSQEAAEQQARAVATLPINIVGLDDLALTKQAAIYKATYGLAYAAAITAALARSRKAELVTGDPAFKPLEREIRIHWLK